MSNTTSKGDRSKASFEYSMISAFRRAPSRVCPSSIISFFSTQRSAMTFFPRSMTIRWTAPGCSKISRTKAATPDLDAGSG